MYPFWISSCGGLHLSDLFLEETRTADSIQNIRNVPLSRDVTVFSVLFFASSLIVPSIWFIFWLLLNTETVLSWNYLSWPQSLSYFWVVMGRSLSTIWYMKLRFIFTTAFHKMFYCCHGAFLLLCHEASQDLSAIVCSTLVLTMLVTASSENWNITAHPLFQVICGYTRACGSQHTILDWIPSLRILTITSYCVLPLAMFVQLEEKAKGKSNCFVCLFKMRL